MKPNIPSAATGFEIVKILELPHQETVTDSKTTPVVEIIPKINKSKRKK